jgi:enolase
LKDFYGRLYGNYKLFKTTKDYIKSTKSPLEKWGNEGGFACTIVGTNPDLTTFRNFVSLDTRSREIRNKIEKLKKGKIEN